MGQWNKRRVIVLVLRLALGCVWLYAAYTKLFPGGFDLGRLRDSWLLFAMSIDSYHLLPEWAVFMLARTLPWLELAIGALLIGGVLLRYASIAGAGLLTVFFGAIISAYSRGLAIDCGCFGAGGDPLSWRTMLRDGTLLAAAVALAVLVYRWRSPLYYESSPCPTQPTATPNSSHL